MRSALQVFLLAAVGIVDAAVQDQFGGAAFDLAERDFREQRDRVVVELRASATGSRSRNRLVQS